MSFTQSKIYLDTLARLKAFEAQGLKYKILEPEGKLFESAEPINPVPPAPVPGKRNQIQRDVRLIDLYKPLLENMNPGDVVQVIIPQQYSDQITVRAWRAAISSYMIVRFGKGSATTANIPNGLEVMRLF